MPTSTRARPTGGSAAPKAGRVRSFVAVTNVVDDVNDILMPGAVRASVSKRWPIAVWHHKIDKFTGRVAGVEEWLPGDPRLPRRAAHGQPWPREAGAVVADIEYNLETQAGRDAYSWAKFFEGTPAMSWSIGYKATQAVKDPRSGIRRIYGIDVYEFSQVSHGAHRLAGTLEVKAGVTDEGLETKTGFGFTGPITCGVHAGEPRTADEVVLEAKAYLDALAASCTYCQTPALLSLQRGSLEVKACSSHIGEATYAPIVTPEPELEKKMDLGTPPGSHQELDCQLRDALREQFKGGDGEVGVGIEATYDTHVVACVRRYGMGGDPAKGPQRSYYVVPYTRGPGGVALGEPQKVQIQATIVPDTPALVAPVAADVQRIAVAVTALPSEAKAITEAVEGPLQDLFDALAIKGVDVAGIFAGDTKSWDPEEMDEDDEKDSDEEEKSRDEREDGEAADLTATRDPDSRPGADIAPKPGDPGYVPPVTSDLDEEKMSGYYDEEFKTSDEDEDEELAAAESLDPDPEPEPGVEPAEPMVSIPRDEYEEDMKELGVLSGGSHTMPAMSMSPDDEDDDEKPIVEKPSRY